MNAQQVIGKSEFGLVHFVEKRELTYCCCHRGDFHVPRWQQQQKTRSKTTAKPHRTHENLSNTPHQPKNCKFTTTILKQNKSLMTYHKNRKLPATRSSYLGMTKNKNKTYPIPHRNRRTL